MNGLASASSASHLPAAQWNESYRHGIAPELIRLRQLGVGGMKHPKDFAARLAALTDEQRRAIAARMLVVTIEGHPIGADGIASFAEMGLV